MANFKKAFFAYPSAPVDLASPIAKAASDIDSSRIALTIWPAMEVFGSVIPDEIRNIIDTVDIIFCDITKQNPNVYYEIGYAIGKGKPIAPVLNTTFAEAESDIQTDGIFDVIGYRGYENSTALQNIIYDPPEKVLRNLYSQNLNRTQPIYLLTALRKSDFINGISAAIKSAGAFFRTFDPAEVMRLSAVHMIADLTASAGVIVPFLAPHIVDAKRHNIRASFVAGISHGLGKATLLLRHRDTGVAPADYRQDIIDVLSEKDIKEPVHELVKSANVALQNYRTPKVRANLTKLQRLHIGAIAAENEFKVLEDYFVETSEYLRAERGDAGIVAGRKGSGKTAIFFMVRDSFRKQKKSVVIDLRPESHQLSLFRAELLRVLEAGAYDTRLPRSGIFYC